LLHFSQAHFVQQFRFSGINMTQDATDGTSQIIFAACCHRVFMTLLPSYSSLFLLALRFCDNLFLGWGKFVLG
jgi:hypothetical protein